MNDQIYQKKSPREHVLLRPDTYVGSVERGTEKMFVLDEQKMMMEEKDVEYVPALYKIFDEILVNAADNKQRDQSMKEIKIKIDIANGSVTIKNDGKGIPIEIQSVAYIFIYTLSSKHFIHVKHFLLIIIHYLVKNMTCIFQN